MILDILTVLFFIGGCTLTACMIWERRRDVLHGRYMIREDIRPTEEAKRPISAPQDALEELSLIVRNIDLDATEEQKGKAKR